MASYGNFLEMKNPSNINYWDKEQKTSDHYVLGNVREISFHVLTKNPPDSTHVRINKAPNCKGVMTSFNMQRYEARSDISAAMEATIIFFIM